jgi:superfamily I DNA/RNA helicase
VRLTRRQRVQVWKAIEDVTSQLARRGERTYQQMADAAARFLAARSVKPYRHVIVDEGQDLHPAQWRMLRAAVPDGPDDLFIVADTHQRIYEHKVTLSKIGIEVRGRSQRLRLNYRSTQEILRWSLALLTGEVFDDLDEGGDDAHAAFHSQLHGGEPVVQGYPSWSDELAALVDAVRDWLRQGVRPHEIGVAARTTSAVQDAEHALTAAGIPARALSRDASAPATADSAVEIATMHRMKGLEYRCSAVIDVSRDHVPPPQALTSATVDPLQHRQDLQRERCLLYVACTRARDCLRVTWNGAPSAFLPATTGHGGQAQR